MTKFKDNLLFLRKKKKLTQEQLSDKLGLGRTTITNYEAGVSEPSFDVLNQIANILDTPIDTLLNIDLESQHKNAQKPSHTYKKTHKDSLKVEDDRVEYGYTKIPLIPLSAQAGFNEFDLSVSRSDIEYWFDVPLLGERADFAFMVEGDSMKPRYNAGSFILCKKLNGIEEIRWEKVCLISVNHSPMVKRIYPSTNKETVLLRSDNPSYRDFEVLRADIDGIAKILATVHREDSESHPIRKF